jgi:hypothetical protein
MSKKYIPFFDKNTYVDNFFKKNFGWLLVVTGKKIKYWFQNSYIIQKKKLSL